LVDLISLHIINCEVKSLDVSNNTKLESFDCRENLISTLDVSKNTKLEYLNCSNNLIPSLDISHCPKINFWFGDAFQQSKNFPLTLQVNKTQYKQVESNIKDYQDYDITVEVK